MVAVSFRTLGRGVFGPRVLMAIGVATVIVAAACSRNARLADHDVRAPEVGSITQYGVTLDQDAEPWHVAYVLLRAVRDDVLAEDDAARNRALDVELRTTAPEVIYAAHKGRLPRSPLSRDEVVFETVYTWAPALAYYVDELDFDLAEAERVIRQDKPHTKAGYDVTTVGLPLLDPRNRAGSVFLSITLVKERGFWRAASLRLPPGPRPSGEMLETLFGIAPAAEPPPPSADEAE